MLLGVASSARGSGGTSGAHGRILSAVAEPALLNEHWLLEDGSAHRCPAGRRSATEEECLAAVREAASRDGLEVFGLKRVNDGAASFVPAGCSYSSHSKTAVFNVNAAGGRVLGSNRLACLAPPEAVPSGAEDECPRQCSDALSVIDLRSIPRLHTGPAGLSDWAFQLEGEGNLAAHLCAQALVPSPADALAPDHNNGARVGPDVPWSRYLVFNATAGWARDTPVWVSPQTSRDRWLERVRDTSSAAPLELTANSVEDVLAQYDQLARLTSGRFVWTINVRYWAWGTPLAQHIRASGALLPKLKPHKPHEGVDQAGGEECDYGEVHSSPAVHAQVDAFLSRIGAAAASEVATLHVRRGDTTDRCNTSVPAVLEYIACALPEGEVLPPHLVLFTDETDARYLAQLLAALKTLPRWRGDVVHGDPIVTARVSADSEGGAPDNYEAYTVASTLMNVAGVALAMERCEGKAPCKLGFSKSPNSRYRRFPYQHEHVSRAESR